MRTTNNSRRSRSGASDNSSNSERVRDPTPVGNFEEGNGGGNSSASHSNDPLDRVRRKLDSLMGRFLQYEKDTEEYILAESTDWSTINGSYQMCARMLEGLKQVWTTHNEELYSLDELDEAERQQDELQRRLYVLEENVNKVKPFRRAEPMPAGGMRGWKPPTLTYGGDSDSVASFSGGMPTIFPLQKFPEFDGDEENFMQYWSQMEAEVHNRQDFSEVTKYRILTNSIKKGTEAYAIVKAHPLADSYQGLVKELLRVYGDKDRQRNYYMKEMLKLVISEANASEREKMPLKALVLRIQGYISSLTALNYNKSDPAAWIVQLVESSLPTRVLYRWKHEKGKKLRQRNEMEEMEGTSSDQSLLDYLLGFLKTEVNVDRDVQMSKRKYTEESKKEDRREKRDDHHHRNRKQPKPRTPTLHAFHTGAASSSRRYCIFCKDASHETINCYKAEKMSYKEKRQIMMELGLCFSCLGAHKADNIDKCDAFKLKCKHCSRNYHSVICNAEWIEEQRAKGGHRGPPRKKRKVDNAKTMTSMTYSSLLFDNIILGTVRMRIKAGRRSKVVRAFLDSGAMQSYLLESTADELGLKIKGYLRIEHNLFGGVVTDPKYHKIYSVQLESLDGSFSTEGDALHETIICNNRLGAGGNNDLLRELERRGIVLSDSSYSSEPIEFLIGSEFFSKVITGTMTQLDCGPLAWETRMGWSVLGAIKNTREKSNCSALSCMSVVLKPEELTNLWDLETIGIRDPYDIQTEDELLEKTKKRFLSEVERKENGRYVVSLPWKEKHPPLPTNRAVALKRLESTASELKKAGYYKEYGLIFEDWLKDGFLERVKKHTDEAHYIPHRPIIKPSSATTPVRPVFDASSKSRGNPSLNDCLEKGMNQILLIVEIMLRFREKRVAFISDIKKAFQMVEVQPKDRDKMRFFWFSPEGKIIVYRHKRVMFGATCSPFILGAILELHLTNLPENEKEIGRQLLNSFYVDNCVYSVDTVEQYQQFREKAVDIMNRAQMDLRLWFSNVDNFDDPSEITMPVLGLQWDRMRDELFVKIPEIIPQKITKRTVLSALHQFYDIFNIFGPALLPMKVRLQKAWRKHRAWDEPLDEEDALYFKQWCHDIRVLEDVRIPRMATGGVTDKEKWTLHVFSDASGYAYGSAVFLRTELEDEVSVQLLMAKPRLSPLPKDEKKKRKKEKSKPISITRLELLGCLLSVRLNRMVKKAYELEKVREVYHTDSSVALAWIKRNDLWGQFVGNRTEEINKFSDVSSWRHVPGKDNPADLLSRGCTPVQLVRSKWWLGPDWLYLPENQWPTSHPQADENEVNEEKRKTVKAVMAAAVITPPSARSIVLERVKNQHTYAQLVRITAHVLRFRYNSAIPVRFRPNRYIPVEERQKGSLRGTELKRAETKLIHNMQLVHQRRKDMGKVHFQDNYTDGVARVKTKLAHMVGHNDFIYPMILPGKAPETRQLIMDTHVSYCHAGVGFLLTKLRKKYWITRARQTIRSVISNCKRCRRFIAQPIATEDAPLPSERIQSAEVFECTGVDIAGPFYVGERKKKKTRGRRRVQQTEEEKRKKKVWLLIFTCGTYRAVHLQVVDALSTEKFINALSFFVRKFGRPKIIYSDNGTNFRGADNLFGQLNWDEIRQHEDAQRIKWKFNPPAAPWWGGWWERLIRIVKGLLQRAIGNGSLNKKELQEVIRGIEEVMNDRPLTYVSENPEDLEPLTPAMFLHPFRSVAFPEEQLGVAKTLRFRYKYVQTLKKELKQRFRREYLAQLVHQGKQKKIRKLNVGDLVFVGDDGKKRLLWKLGRIQELFMSADNQERVAKIKIIENEKPIFITRAVQRLYPLECEHDQEEDETVIRTVPVYAALYPEAVEKKDSDCRLMSASVGNLADYLRHNYKQK